MSLFFAMHRHLSLGFSPEQPKRDEQNPPGAVRPLGEAEGSHKRKLRETARDTLFAKPL